jgi:hypothetical protein
MQMKLLFAILIILFISLLGSRLTFLNRRLSLGFRNIMFTGTEYIFIGALLGGMGLDVLDGEALKQLEPFLVFGLCWVGFLFGLQFNRRQLKHLAGHYFSVSAVQAFVTFVFVSLSMYWLLERYTDFPELVRLMIAVTLGSSASCTAQSALAIVSKNYKFKNRRLLDLMRFISGLDGLYALIFFAAALSLFPNAEVGSFNLLSSLEWTAVTCAIGVLPALILISLSRVRFTDQEFLVFVIGTVILCGGLSHQIKYSPLISGMICGVITANFCRHSIRAFSVVQHAEKSLYIILLILLGAGWDFKFKVDYILLLTAVYFAVRVVGKYIGAMIAAKSHHFDYHVPASIGLGLISDGGIAAAIIIDFKLLYPAFAYPLITIIIITVLVNELLSPWLILGRFDKDERVATDGKITGKIDIRQLWKKTKR